MPYAEDGTLTLIDWKRTDKYLSLTFDQATYRGPLEGMNFRDNDLNKYTLQLNLYKHLLSSGYVIEDSTGRPLKVGAMLVVQLHPKLKGGVKVTQASDLPIHVNRIIKWLEDRVKDDVADVETQLEGLVLRADPGAAVRGHSETETRYRADAGTATPS